MTSGHPAETMGLAAITPEILLSRILVVDDVALNRILIGELLQSFGFTMIAYADDGEAALREVDRFDPDLVILDIDMPVMDGIEVCRILNTDPTRRRIPVLMQTAFDGPKERGRAFEAGASDFVSKPINQAELLSRVRVHLENHHLILGLQRYQDRIQAELALAREMQAALLPSAERIDEIQTNTGLSIAAYFATSSELGGDFWGLQPLPGQRATLMMVDFSGHGVTAALNTFRLHTLIGLSGREEAVSLGDPSRTLATLNSRLHQLLPRGQYATVTHAVLDPMRDQIIYSAAGSPQPLMIGPTGETHMLETRGLPLGFLETHTYELRTHIFPPGASLLFFSDALIESPDGDGALLDETDIEAAMRAGLAQGSAASDVLDAVLGRFYTGRENPLPDDLTLVCVTRPISA